MGNSQIGPVGSYIDIFPSYSYQFAETIDRQDMRTRQGNLYTYIGQADYLKYTIPLTWVNSSDRSLINSWWRSGTTVNFIEDSTFPNSAFSCRIMGAQEPFNKYMDPYFGTQWDGEIVLEVV